jgi:putative oxidoreductase
MNKLNKWSPFFLSVLRIVAGFLFVAHGTQKVLSFPIPPVHAGTDVISQLSGIIELVGGALVLIGLFTRFAAFIVSGEMAVAYFKAHAVKGLWPLVNGGELAVLYCFVFLYLFFAGGGPLSLDALIRKKA